MEMQPMRPRCEAGREHLQEHAVGVLYRIDLDGPCTRAVDNREDRANRWKAGGG